jgi:hypothetical protein
LLNVSTIFHLNCSRFLTKYLGHCRQVP